MKEVLKHGTTWERRNRLMVCPHCKCEFVFDIIEDVDIEYDGFKPIGKRYLSCPECGYHIENYQ